MLEGILSGLAFGVDATSECVRASPMHWGDEGEEGASDGPEGDRDRDLETWLDDFDVC